MNAKIHYLTQDILNKGLLTTLRKLVESVILNLSDDEWYCRGLQIRRIIFKII